MEWYEDSFKRKVRFWLVFCLGLGMGISLTVLWLSYRIPPSPQSRLHLSQLQFYDNRLVIASPGILLSSYAPTGSMLPTLDSGMKGLNIRPLSRDDIQVGDIITFNRGNISITHRVISKGHDRDGWYSITRGDNNIFSDGKIRFPDISAVQIGVIY